MRLIFCSPIRPIEPASTVKSYAATATWRPSMLADARHRAVGREESTLVGRIHAVGEQAVLDPRSRVDK